MRETWQLFSIEQDIQAHKPCTCPPLTSAPIPGEHVPGQREPLPISPALNRALRAALASAFSRSEPFSLFLLHIVQFKYIQTPANSTLTRRRENYHAPASLQGQILHTIRRTLRASDEILADEHGTGAVILFPRVDAEGITRIAERISYSINLLRAETIVPPLQDETEIAFGFASYPEPAPSLEELLASASQVQEKITFRPAVVSRRERIHTRASRVSDSSRKSRSKEARLLEAQTNGIPFMQIPSRLPTRLKQLIPHSLALALRCAPIGRNHNQLTVAMANPMDTQAIYRLREVTGMTIFPVSCEMPALDTLLASGW